MYVPSEQDIQKIMRETCMDRIQAINHLRSREWVREQGNAKAPAIYPTHVPGTIATLEVTTSLGLVRICVRPVSPYRWRVFVDGGLLADGRSNAHFPDIATALEFAAQEARRAEDEPEGATLRDRLSAWDERNHAAVRARLGRGT